MSAGGCLWRNGKRKRIPAGGDAWWRGSALLVRALALAVAVAASFCAPCCAATRESQVLARMAAQWQAGGLLTSWQAEDVCGAAAGGAGGPPGITCEGGSVTALNLSGAGLSGSLPSEIGNLTALTLLDLSYNALSGSLPSSISQLARLQLLYIHWNKLNGSLPDGLSALTTLQRLNIQRNSFSGTLPAALFSLTTLRYLYMDGNRLSGSLPATVGRLTNLVYLQLTSNAFNGTLPNSLSLLTGLYDLELQKNRFSGSFPSSITSMRRLTMLYMSNNSFTGAFPEFIGNMTQLAYVKIFSNDLSGTLPQSYSQLRNLTHLDLRDMQLYGSLPSWLGDLPRLRYLHVRNNDLSGSVPESLGQLTNLIEISLIGNPKLNGTLPACWANILSLGTMDNPVPDLPFCVNFCPQYCNACAPGLPPATIAAIAVSSILLLLAVVTLSLYVWFYYWGPNRIRAWERELDRAFRKYSWREIMAATDGMSEGRKLGKGGFGTVYRGTLYHGQGGSRREQQVAIKHAAFVERSTKTATMFEEEVKAVSRFYHRNVVRLLGYCNENQEQVLVYEYVANGPLSDHLYGDIKGELLSFEQRLEAAIGLAEGLVYLHNHTERPTVHRDIKPTNVLLTHDYQVKIADFGLLREVGREEMGTFTQVAGTRGYLDPDYMTLALLTTRSDVYSFGVLLLELVTGREAMERNPSDGEELVHITTVTLPFIASHLAHLIVDTRIATPLNLPTLLAMAQIAVACVQQPSSKRPEMAEVVKALHAARRAYHAAAAAAAAAPGAAGVAAAGSGSSGKEEVESGGQQEEGIPWSGPSGAVLHGLLPDVERLWHGGWSQGVLDACTAVPDNEVDKATWRMAHAGSALAEAAAAMAVARAMVEIDSEKTAAAPHREADGRHSEGKAVESSLPRVPPLEQGTAGWSSTGTGRLTVDRSHAGLLPRGSISISSSNSSGWAGMIWRRNEK